MIFTLLVLGELTFLLLSSYAICYIFAFVPVLFSFSNICTVHFCAALVLLLLYSFCDFCEWNIFPFINAVVSLFFFWPCCVACGIFLFPDQGLNPHVLQQPRRVLTTGLPGKSLKMLLFLQRKATELEVFILNPTDTFFQWVYWSYSPFL